MEVETIQRTKIKWISQKKEAKIYFSIPQGYQNLRFRFYFCLSIQPLRRVHNQKETSVILESWLGADLKRSLSQKSNKAIGLRTVRWEKTQAGRKWRKWSLIFSEEVQSIPSSPSSGTRPNLDVLLFPFSEGISLQHHHPHIPPTSGEQVCPQGPQVPSYSSYPQTELSYAAAVTTLRSLVFLNPLPFEPL